ncbi:MAG: NAD(P)H-quinone oxidoreductase [Acidobacteriota bacterium]
MRVILFNEPGDEAVLRIGEANEPRCGPRDLRIRVYATAVNRADLLQRRGQYPPPPGASSILGLECAGEIVEVGSKVEGWTAGERVMALLAGGGYAEEVVVDAGSAMRMPQSFSWEEGGAFPETFITAFLNIFLLGEPPDGGRVLVHGGGSGVGTSAISLCREASLPIYITAGSREKCDRCEALGAAMAINYRESEFETVLLEALAGAGVHVILDHLGAEYLQRDLEVLAPEGRIVLIGSMGGTEGTIDTSLLLRKRARLIGSTLRARPNAEKASIVEKLLVRFGETLQAGRLRPVIDSVFPLAQAAQAHARMQSGEHFGKIALRVR